MIRGSGALAERGETDQEEEEEEEKDQDAHGHDRVSSTSAVPLQCWKLEKVVL